MERKGIDATIVKMIAIVAMMIDHIGVVLVLPYIRSMGITEVNLQDIGKLTEYKELVYLYLAFRCIGRIAFPIFAYFIVEGITHTRDLTKYALRLLGFGILSEVPFDLAFNHEVFELSHQNVFFTLFLGVLALWGYETISRKVKENDIKVGFGITALAFVMALAGVVLAEIFRTDYAGIGVLVILAFYLTREDKRVQMVVGGIAIFLANNFGLYGIFALFALVPIYFYNKERGKGIKFFFYGFYPVHLLLLYGIAVLLGLEAF